MLRDTAENIHRAYEVSRRRMAGRSNKEIGEELRLDPATISRLLNLARARGLYVELAIPPRDQDVALESLREEMERRLKLRDVRLVPGWEELVPDDPAEWSRPLSRSLHSTREAIFRSATRVAARLLDEKIEEHRVLCLAWGQTVHALIQFLHPHQRRPSLEILPMIGVLQLQPGQTEANSLVRQMADIYGAKNYYCLPIPAIVPGADQKRVAVTLPLVDQVLRKLDVVDFVVASVAEPDPEESTLARLGLVSRETIRGLIESGAVGEICACWFNQAGEAVGDDVIQPIGMSLAGLRAVIARRGRVLATVAGDCSRIQALAAAIRGGLINVLVTDHVTGQALLRLMDSRSQSA